MGQSAPKTPSATTRSLFTAYLSRFLCWWLLAVSAYCTLSGVKSGVNTGLVHHRQDLQCLHFHPASRCTPETLPPVVRRFPAPRVEEEPVSVLTVREVEQLLEVSRLRVEGLIAYPAQSPVILDKAQHRGLVRDRVVHEILLGVRGDHLQGQPRSVAAAVLVRSRLGLTAHPRPGEEVVVGVA